MVSSMFTRLSTYLLGTSRKSLAIIRFQAVSQMGNSVWPLHSLTAEERESVKVSPLAGTPINLQSSEIWRSLDNRFLQNLHCRYHCIS